MQEVVRIFIDVAILVEFKGNLPGISRTIFNITRNAYRIAPETTRIGTLRFDKASGKYRVLSPHETCELLDRVAPGTQDHARIREFHTDSIEAGSMILLLGEQWLYPGLGSELRRIKLEKQAKVCTLIHDLVPFFSPQFYWDGFPEDFCSTMSQVMIESDVMFCYSDNTDKDVRSISKSIGITDTVVPKRIKLGDHVFNQKLLDDATPPAEKNYILCVGTIQPRKNHFLLLYVWKMLIARYGNLTPTLVLLGNRGWHVDDFFYYVKNDPELKDKVVFKTDSSDQELVSYYLHSQFTLFPSFYEGWGLPVAESLALGRFCISSSSSSMPEIGGDLVDYHDPFDSGALFDLISKYIENPDLLAAREERIKREFVKTSWELTTRQILKHLTER